MDTELIIKLAQRAGWKQTPATNGGIMLTFVKDGVKIEIWPKYMTVATMLKHPKQGKTKLFRRRVQRKELEAIFDNPRVHTTGGYQRVENRKEFTRLS